MNSHVTERNTQIIAAYTAGNRNKSELARYFGVSATTVRRVLAGVVMISSGTVALSPTIALAELKGDELAAAQAYIAAQPDMPQYLKNTILNGTDLTAVNYQLKNNEYVIQATQEHIKTPPISLEEYRQHQSEKQAAELTAYQHNDPTGTPTHQIAEATHPDAPSDAALSDARVAAREADQLAIFTAMKNAEAQENQRQAHADRMPALNNAEPTHLDAPSDADLLAARHDAREADQLATFTAMKNAEAQENQRQAHADRMPALNNAEPTHLDAPSDADLLAARHDARVADQLATFTAMKNAEAQENQRQAHADRMPALNNAEPTHLDAPSDADLLAARHDARVAEQLATFNAMKNAEAQENQRQAHADRMPALNNAEPTHLDAPSDADLLAARHDARVADQLATFTAMKNAEAQENQRQAHADRMPALNNAEPTHLDGPSDADLLAARHDARVADQLATFTAMKNAEAQENQRQAHADRMPALNNAEPTHLDAPSDADLLAARHDARVADQLATFNAMKNAEAQENQRQAHADRMPALNNAEPTHLDAPSDADLLAARHDARVADQVATFNAMKTAEAQTNERQAHAGRMPALNNAEPTHLDAPSDDDLLAARHDARVADQVATFNAMKTAEAQTNERQAHAGRMPALNNAEPTHLDAPAHIEPETVTSTTNIGNQKAESQSQLTSKKYASANGKSVTQITSTPAQQPVVKQEVRSTYYDKQITALNAAAEQDHTEVLAESHSRAVGDANTLSQANDYTNKKFSDLKSEVDDNKDQANAGTASALAAVGIPQVEAGSDFMVGAGAGTYGNQSAIAVGVSGHITAKTVTKLAVTGDTNNGVGASAGIGWNF